MIEMYYQGHGSYRFVIDNKKVVYVDPFAGDGYGMIPDLVLVTHEHSDHNRLELLKMGPKTVLIREKSGLNPDGFIDLGWISVQAVPASNANHDSRCCFGYLIKSDGKTIYSSGDTSMTDYMQRVLPKLHIYMAILPCDGIYNMGPEEAARCADVIGAEYSIPVHSCPGELFSAEIVNRFQPHKSKRIILIPGYSFVF